MVKVWGFEFFLATEGLEGKDLVDYFDFYVDLWVRAEQLGYDGVLLSEHHFGGGYSPSPNLLIPMIAKRTTNLRLGIMGMVAPYHNAWRLAEEAGMLDVITNGRFEFGTSAGIPSEFAQIGMGPGEARERYDEALQIIDAAMKEPVVTHKGKYWNFENLPIIPRPVQADLPRWTTVISEGSARKAAARGSKLATGFVPTTEVKKVFDAYNEAAAAAGQPTGPDRLALRRQVLLDVGDDPAAMDHAKQFSEGFRQMLESNDWRVKKTKGEALDAPSGAHGYELGNDEFIAGKPAEVADQILEQCNASGAGHFQVVFAGAHTPAAVARAWEVFGNEVIPLLKKEIKAEAA
jgi:alkanesulfonate monooxygenase SsuD/methylene tetrahydromethanopterin reductase-like flavin-dependent oxidoreductase (luciferase family)